MCLLPSLSRNSSNLQCRDGDCLACTYKLRGLSVSLNMCFSHLTNEKWQNSSQKLWRMLAFVSFTWVCTNLHIQTPSLPQWTQIPCNLSKLCTENHISIKPGILRTYHIYIPIYYGLLTWITTAGTNRVLWSFTAIYTVFMAWLTFSRCIIFASRADCCAKRTILYILTISAVAWPWPMTCWITFFMAQHTHIGCCFVHPVQKTWNQ